MPTLKEPDVDAARALLVPWYRANARALPWRQTRDPWAVWVSEVMLQQTRVDTVVPYYTRFLQRFPTVTALADAAEPDVLALWSGLGYYRRARLLHAGARAVVDRHGGVIPGEATALRALPGVGDYTAGALGSIAFGLSVPLVDGNVERVLTRLHGLRGDPRAAPLKKRLWTLAARYAEHAAPGDVNQALMELGATVCAPTAPRCLVCPVRSHCVAAAEGEPTRYPEKAPSAAPRDERWCALVARDGDRVWLVESELGRWQGMLLTPLVETRAAPVWEAPMSTPREVAKVTHVLTHARMAVTVYEAHLTGAPPRGRLVARDALSSLAVPKITRSVLAAADGDAHPRRRR
jgi:A/G-specific adenine glycosylase